MLTDSHRCENSHYVGIAGIEGVGGDETLVRCIETATRSILLPAIPGVVDEQTIRVCAECATEILDIEPGAHAA